MRFIFIYDFFMHTIEVFFCLFFCCYVCFFANQSYLLGVPSSTLVSKNKPACFSAILLIFFSILILSNTPVFYGYSFFFTLQNTSTSFFIKIFILALTFFYFYSLSEESFFIFEFFSMVLLSLFGILLILQCNDLTVFYLSIELQTLSLYFLAAYKRNSSYSIEAGVKYFVIGAFSSCVLLYGISFLYAFLGSTNYQTIFFLTDFVFLKTSFFVTFGFIFILIGLFFKLGVAPLHFWVGDVYDGAATLVVLFFTTVPKLSIICFFFTLIQEAFFNFYENFQFVFLLFGLASICIGAFFTFYQKKTRKFFAFSSVNHLGFFFVSFSTGSFFGFTAIFFYIFVYVITSFCVWLILQTAQKKNKRINYLVSFVKTSAHNHAYRLCFSLLIFSIAGIPPFIGFLPKAFVIFAATESMINFTVSCIIFFSVFSTVYYLKIIKGFFFISTVRQEKLRSRQQTFTFFKKSTSLCISGFSFFVFLSSIFPNNLYLFSFLVSLL